MTHRLIEILFENNLISFGFLFSLKIVDKNHENAVQDSS